MVTELAPCRPIFLAMPLRTAPASAAKTTVTLTLWLDIMFCAACSNAACKAIAKLQGVVTVTVDRRTKFATIVFDDAVANVEKFAVAARDAGLPAER